MKKSRRILSLALVCLMLLTTGCSAVTDGVSNLLRNVADRLDQEETVAAQESPAQSSKDEVRSEESKTAAEDETPAAQKDTPALDLGELGDLLSSDQPALPVIEYNGTVYKLGMTFDPDNPSGPFADSSTSSKRMSLGDGVLDCFGRRWAQMNAHPHWGQYMQMPAGTDESHLYVFMMVISAPGASIEGLSVGDPLETVMETFPQVEAVSPNGDHTSIELYLRDGVYYTREAYEAAFPIPDKEDEDYVRFHYLHNFETYILSFRFDGHDTIDRIYFGDVHGVTTGG